MRQLRYSRLVGSLGLGILRDYDTRGDSGIGWNTLVKGGAGILWDDGEGGLMVVMLLLFLFLMMKRMECRVMTVVVGVVVVTVVSIRGGFTKILVFWLLVLLLILLMLLMVAMLGNLRWMLRWVLRMRVRVGMLGIIINRPRVEVVLDGV